MKEKLEKIISSLDAIEKVNDLKENIRQAKIELGDNFPNEIKELEKLDGQVNILESDIAILIKEKRDILRNFLYNIIYDKK